jgi:hypothetical protein
MTERTLIFKEGVHLVGLQREALVAIDRCLHVFHSQGLTMTLTSARGDKHGAYSHHYKGLAFDIRVWDIPDVDVMVMFLREALGEHFQVINEGDHIHVEYDPKHITEELHV